MKLLDVGVTFCAGMPTSVFFVFSPSVGFQEKFVNNIRPILDFAHKLFDAAEKFDEKKGLPKELLDQIPTYLNLDPLSLGLVGPTQTKEGK